MDMHPTHTLTLSSRDTRQTLAMGRQIGRLLTTGLLLCLDGDLGSGKTVFVKGLAEGLAVPETVYVTSPSYTLINEYPGRRPLYHADLYRLQTAEDVEAIGFFDLLTEDNVVAVEWAHRLENCLPPQGLWLEFTIVDDTTRTIRMRACGLPAADVLRRLEKMTR